MSKSTYKGCEIEVNKETCPDGNDILYFSIFDNEFEITSGFSEANETIREFMEDLKMLVDDYRNNPDKYFG